MKAPNRSCRNPKPTNRQPSPTRNRARAAVNSSGASQITVSGGVHLVDKAIYALRTRIERFFNRIKNSRRVATRYDKLVESFAAFVLLATIRLWFRFVHTT
jgi:transposase